MRRIVGPSGGGQSFELPRASGRGGQREAWLQPLRKHRLASNGNCIAGNQCERSGLSPKLLSNPFHGVIAYPEALFRRHLSRQSAELGDRRYRAPQSIDQLPNITPGGRA